MRTTLALLAMFALAACSQPVPWNGPGWYLMKPNLILPGADYYGGPMAYEDCEIARKKEATAAQLLCQQLLAKPE